MEVLICFNKIFLTTNIHNTACPCGDYQIKSNHFYCHITTAQVPWWVKFLWACSRQCRKTTDNLPMDRQCKKNNRQFTYGQTVQKKLHWSIYSAPDSAKKTQQQQFTYGQTVQKNNSNLHMDRQCKKTTAIYIWTDSAKKQQQFTYGQTMQKSNSNLHMDRQCKKTTAIYIWTDSAKKQQQFTYGQYIFTDCTEDNVQNTHTYTQYT